MGINIWTAVRGIGQYFAENANSRQKRICARRGPMRRAAVYWLAAAMASIDRAGSLSQADKNEHHVSRWLIITSLLPVVMQIELIQVKSHFSINLNEFFIKFQLKLYVNWSSRRADAPKHLIQPTNQPCTMYMYIGYLSVNRFHKQLRIWFCCECTRK